MATFDTMKTGVALRCHDSTKTEISDTNYGVIINQAVDDLTSEGIVLPLAEDESIAFSADTWSYNVPSDFAYIRELREEDAVGSGKYPNVIHPTLWRLILDSGTTPVIQFDTNEYDLPTATTKLKVVGQKRVAQLTGTDTVPPGLEAFIRERAISYAAATLSGGGSGLSAWRQNLSEQCWARSLDLLRRIPREYRPWPDSRRVPER